MTRSYALERPRLGDRDTRLFVIAVEGEVTEPWYFLGLGEHGITGVRIRLELLTPAQGESDPGHTANRLLANVERHRRRPSDEYWLVVDVDRHDPTRLVQAVMDVRARAQSDAVVSRPCFEVWLVLHLTDACEATTSQHAKDAWRALRAASPTPAWPFSRESVEAAVARARGCADGLGSEAPATDVWRLVSRLLELAPARQ